MLNILLVEDELIVRKGMTSLIQWESHGFRLFEAAHGKEALEIMKNTNIDILITDIAMPVMDGWALIKNIHDEKIHCEVIILSSYDEFEYARKAMKLKVRDYIHKPTIMPEELIEILKSIATELSKHKAEENYRDIIKETAVHSCRFLLEKVIKSYLLGTPLEEKLLHMLRGNKLMNTPVYLSLLSFARKMVIDEDDTGRENTEKRILTTFLKECEKEDPSVVFYRMDTDWVILSIEHSIMDEWVEPLDDNLEILSVACTQPLEWCEVKGKYAELRLQISQKKQDWQTSNKLHPFVQDSLKYIHDNYSLDLSLESISKHIHVSPTYFSKLFDEQVGINFINYLTNVRINKAKELLLKTNLTIYEIANQVGYGNSKYFTKVFKKIEQTTPGEFRKENRL